MLGNPNYGYCDVLSMQKKATQALTTFTGNPYYEC